MSLQKLKDTFPCTYVIINCKVEEIIGTFCEKELQNTNQKEFRIEKIIIIKGNKIYVKWKGYNNSVNNWTDKEDIVTWKRVIFHLMVIVKTNVCIASLYFCMCSTY